MADGLTNARIGKQLCVTEQTVKFHLSNIYRKLGVSNRTEASRYVHLHVPGLAKRIAPRLVPEWPTRPAPPEPGGGSAQARAHAATARDSSAAEPRAYTRHQQPRALSRRQRVDRPHRERRVWPGSRSRAAGSAVSRA